jgi:hypothetical protein
MRRAVAVLAIVVGVGLIALPVVESLFSRTQAGQRVLDRFRQMTSDDGFAQLTNDVGEAKASGKEVLTEFIPTFSRELGLTEAQLSAYVEENFPTVADGFQQTPAATVFITGFVSTIDENREKFLAADEIPTATLPLTTVPWILVLTGALLIGGGAAALTLQGRGPIVAIALTGAVGMVVIPLVWSLPSKASDAEDVSEVAASALNPETATKASDLNSTVDRVVTEIETRFFPALAEQLDVSMSDFSARLEREYPATTELLGHWPAILNRNNQLLAGMEASFADFEQADEVPFETLPWLVIVPGIVLTLVTALALMLPATRSEPEPPKG